MVLCSFCVCLCYRCVSQRAFATELADMKRTFGLVRWRKGGGAFRKRFVTRGVRRSAFARVSAPWNPNYDPEHCIQRELTAVSQTETKSLLDGGD